MTDVEPSGAWVVAEEPALAGCQVEWMDADGLIVSRRNQLFRTHDPARGLEAIGSFPASAWKAAAAHCRPAQRMLRFLFTNVVKLPDGRTFVAFDRDIGVLGDDGIHRLAGLVRPSRILRSACAVFDGALFFGEYLSNAERGPMRIYRLAPGATQVEVVHIFSSGEVRHIHGLYQDPYTHSLWCLTGDRGDECRMLRSDDGCETLELVGGGDESWRAVSLLFRESALYYATDAEFATNRIYRLDRESGERETLAEIDGPAYYSRCVGKDLFFAVTAELCPSQDGRSATLWHLEEGGRPRPITSFEKDPWPVKGFLAGTIHMPGGPGAPDRFYLNGVGLTGADDRTFCVKRSCDASEGA